MRFCENPKGCKWPVFSTDKLTGKGYCRSCATKLRTDLDRRSIIVKAMEKQNRLENKVRGLATPNEGESKLKLWFSFHMNNSDKVCQNCNTNLSHYNPKEWHGSQHHIIDKALCPSVATHPLNHLILGFWCCHQQWHTSLLNASKMPVFQKAKEKFELFKDRIAPDELSKLNKHPFLLQIEPANPI